MCVRPPRGAVEGKAKGRRSVEEYRPGGLVTQSQEHLRKRKSFGGCVETADRGSHTREVFADVLNTDAGRLAHLIICAEIVQAAERDAVHARLAPHARRFASELLTAR